MFFSTVVSDNDSAKELMQKDKFRELAVILTERVKANASIDWTIKESVRAKLKVNKTNFEAIRISTVRPKLVNMYIFANADRKADKI